MSVDPMDIKFVISTISIILAVGAMVWNLSSKITATQTTLDNHIRSSNEWREHMLELIKNNGFKR